MQKIGLITMDGPEDRIGKISLSGKVFNWSMSLTDVSRLHYLKILQELLKNSANDRYSLHSVSLANRHFDFEHM